MLFSGLLLAARREESEIAAKNVPEAHRQLIKAQDIIVALSNNLNMEQGGVIAQNLFLLYDFMYESLVRANLKKDPEPLQKVKEIMTDLRDAWDHSVVQGKPPPVSAAAA